MKQEFLRSGKSDLAFLMKVKSVLRVLLASDQSAIGGEGSVEMGEIVLRT